MAAEGSHAHDSKLESAGAALQRCNELIAEEARAEYKKEATLFRTRKLLTNIDQVAMVLEGIAELHPIAKGAVKQFRCLIGLELDRQNNNEQIVAICHTMANMLYTIHLITDDIESDTYTGLKHQLENEMDQATVVMCDFGVFADMYYVKMSARVVRYLRTTQFKRELGGYAEKFNGHRRSLTDLLTARIHSKAVKGGQELTLVLRNTDRILEKMVMRHTDAERAAAKIVADYGGEEKAMRNPDAVRKVAAMLELEPGAHKEPVTDTTLHLLTGDFSELLKENRGRFELKLGRMTSEIRNSINRGAELIVHRLDQGPYNMIEDPDIRALWKSGQWRMSAKARSFMHEFYMHYIDLFYKTRLSGEPVPDQWTLKVLDVTYHPALSEAVDEDATGYLSVHELNQFTRRKPPHFSIPVWFAFWAVGCRYLNATIAASMEKSLADIERKCEQLKDDIIGADFAIGVEEYLNTCSMLRYVLSYCQLVDVDEHRILADVDDDTSGHLQEWAHKYHEYVSKGFEKQLEALHHCIDDSALLYVVIGTVDEHDRIEQAFFPLADVIIRNQHTAIKGFFNSNDRKPKRIDQFTQKLSEMDATIYTLLSEYHKRMKGLMRSWRSQKLDVELEIECYNGGIMYGWYTAYQDPKTFIRRKFDGSTPGTHMSQRANRTISAVLNKVNTLSEHAERHSAQVGELSMSVTKLSTQVDAIDGRISTMSSTLEKRTAWSFLPDKRDILLAGMAAWLVYMYRRS